jgi:hypothetical protein
MKRVVAAGAIAAVAAALLIAFAASQLQLDATANRRSASDVESNRGLLGLLENYDGGDYAAIARDPTLARPHIYATRGEAAYREQRPLFGELAWVGSLGDPGRVPMTLAVLSSLSATFAVMALGAALARSRISPFFALGVFALPGVFTIVYDMMPELLQLALLTVGLLAWEATPRRRTRWAIVAFALAALTRESSLLVPLVLMATELPRIRARSSRRMMQLLTIPFLAYAGWISFLRVRVGEWPLHSPSPGLTAVPFGGLVHALRDSPYRGSTALWLAAGVLVFACALGTGRRGAWLGVAAAFAVMGVFLSSTVWQRPDFFGRVLLPLYAYSAMLAGTALWDRRAFVTLERDRTPARSGVA